MCYGDWSDTNWSANQMKWTESYLPTEPLLVDDAELFTSLSQLMNIEAGVRANGVIELEPEVTVSLRL